MLLCTVFVKIENKEISKKIDEETREINITANCTSDPNIEIKGKTNFLKHYAGHVETGEESITDPFMGGVV